MARLTKYGPMNSAAVDLLDEETKAQLPNAHIDTAVRGRQRGLAKDIDAYGERYSEWLAQG